MLVASSTVANAKPSNPAFLGIGMQDAQSGSLHAGPPTIGPCMVLSVTRGSGAMAAGLQPGDLLHEIDGTPVANCDAVQKAVQAHEAGETVKVRVARYGKHLTLAATLLSRDEILRRRHVGQPIGATDVFVLDEQRTYDLGALRGKTAVVGWFDRRCDGCKAVFTKVAAWSRAQAGKGGAAPMPFAVTAGDPDNATQQALAIGTLDVPLAIAEPALYEEFTIPDAERIHFMVVDLVVYCMDSP